MENGKERLARLCPRHGALRLRVSPFMSPEVVPAEEAPWKAGLRGARANLVPGLVLQVFALTVVVGYYQISTWQEAMTQLTHWREAVGPLFPILSTGLAGGLLPLLFLKSFRRTRLRYTWAQGAALTAFWAYKGFEINTLYGV